MMGAWEVVRKRLPSSVFLFIAACLEYDCNPHRRTRLLLAMIFVYLDTEWIDPSCFIP